MPDSPANAPEQEDYSLQINQELYQRNFELTIRNQTLTTLRRLYELTTSTLSVNDLSHSLVDAIADALHLEAASIFLFSDEFDNLTQISTAGSGHYVEANTRLRSEGEIQVSVREIENAVVDAFISGHQKTVLTPNPVFEGMASDGEIEAFLKDTKIITTYLYPLSTEKRNIGVIALSYNREMKDVSEFEKDAMDRFVEVVAVSLDKALVYEELHVANENLKKLDEAKSEFMSIASHQLRTPLAGILGYLSMMLQGDYGTFEETQEKTIQEVYQASQRLVRLVNTFLNVTRIEAGRFTLTYVDSNIIDVVEQQVKELLPTANKKGLKLSFEKPEQKEIIAAVDDKIRDVFINLVDNAIKYTQEGSVTVRVMDEGDTVHFTCSDTGVGIAPEEAKSLFQKFVRGSEIARVQPDGSGLGLYIVKRVVDGHHGEIWAASEGVGKGTTFHVVVPKHQAEESFKAEAEQIFTGAKNVGTDEEIPLEEVKK